MPFTGDIAELPGFFPPKAVNVEDRIFAQPDGSVEFDYLVNLPTEKLSLNHQIDISWHMGVEIIVLATLHTSVIYPRTELHGRKSFVVRVPRDVIYFWPGNYRMQGYDLDTGREVFNKSLVVKSTPRLVTTNLPSLVRYTAGYGLTAPLQIAPPNWTGHARPQDITIPPPLTQPYQPDPRFPVDPNGIRLVAAQPYTILGSGSPEGVVVADLAAQYVDTGTGELWFKVTQPGTAQGWYVPPAQPGSELPTAPAPPAPLTVTLGPPPTPGLAQGVENTRMFWIQPVTPAPKS